MTFKNDQKLTEWLTLTFQILTSPLYEIIVNLKSDGLQNSKKAWSINKYLHKTN